MLLRYFFWIEYFSKLKNPDEIRKITSSTLDDGEGRRCAETYFRGHFKTVENLHNMKFGNLGRKLSKKNFQRPRLSTIPRSRINDIIVLKCDKMADYEGSRFSSTEHKFSMRY